jgi:CDP-diacylglycerol pyrophosphatase
MRGLRLTAKRVVALVVVAGAVVALRVTLTSAFDPNALWRIVSDRCVPNELEHASPVPCAQVDVKDGTERGYAVLKDNAPSKPHHYLLIPTRHISGIESPLILEPSTPAYFQFAWEARSFVASSVHARLAWDMIGLAVNSAVNRSQDQLHIHIDCIRREIRELLRDNEDALTSHWSEVVMRPPDPSYWALKIDTPSLAGKNPFLMLADGLSSAKDHMNLETLVVAGAVFRDGKKGFYLLSRQASETMPAHGEDLLDMRCELADAQ